MQKGLSYHLNTLLIQLQELPECLAVPLWEISKDLGLQPIVSYATLGISNWKLKDPSQ